MNDLFPGLAPDASLPSKAALEEAPISTAPTGVKRRLAFEQAIAHLSAKFVNLPPAQVDQEITGGLETLTNALGTDRTNLGQIDPQTGDLVVTHTWTRPGNCFVCGARRDDLDQTK